ncbi:IS110 family transposase [bacterium]|nr:IS110 family transposase [bacterium]
MDKSNRYLGIDIAQASFEVSFLQFDGSYKVQSFENKESGWHALNCLLTESDICMMEATGAYHLGLSTYLYKAGKKVCVVNPLSVKHFSRMRMSRAKTDKIDSCLLSEYGELLCPDLWKPKESQLTDLQQLMCLSEQLIKQKTALNNQLKSFQLVPHFNEWAVEIIEIKFFL